MQHRQTDGELANNFKCARYKQTGMAILHHNNIMPHGGMCNKTPAEAAGIEIRDADMRQTLVQNAAAAA